VRRTALSPGRPAPTVWSRVKSTRPRAVVDIRITALGMVGRDVRFTVRADRLPAKTVTEIS
jgi:hypothetical protein